MSNVDYVEQDRLTDKQKAFVDAYMTNGFNRVKAFYSAGYNGTEERAAVRVSRMLKNRLVVHEIARRREENMAGLQQHTPLDVMIKNLEYWFARATDPILTEVDRHQARSNSQNVAKDAAPYVHSRLQTIVHAGDKDNPPVVHIKMNLNRPDGEEDNEDRSYRDGPVLEH